MWKGITEQGKARSSLDWAGMVEEVEEGWWRKDGGGGILCTFPS